MSAHDIVVEAAPRPRGLVIAALCGTSFLVGMDNTILNVALPTLSRELGASTSVLQWIVDAYTLAFAVLLLTGGTLADRLGRKRVLVGGYLLFLLGGVVAAVAADSATLIAARLIMGVGAAVMVPATLSTIATICDTAASRATTFTLWAALNGAGVVVGPPLGGLLLGHFWWGSIFVVFSAAVVLGLIAVLALVPVTRADQVRAIDWLGTVTAALGCGALVFGLIEGPDRGWTAPGTLVALIGAVVILAVFAVAQVRSRQPMLDRQLLGGPNVPIAMFGLGAVFLAMFGVLFLVTQYLQAVRGYSPLTAGLTFLPGAPAIAIGAKLGPMLRRSLGFGGILSAGLTIMLAGLVFGLTTGIGSSVAPTLVVLVIGGLGYGMVLSVGQDTVMGALPPRRAGVGGAANTTVMQVGGSIGVAVIGTLADIGYRANLTLPQSLPAPLADAARDSVGQGVAVADHVGGSAGALLMRDVHLAFIDGYRAGLIAALAVVVVTLVAVLIQTARSGGRSPDDRQLGADALDGADALEGGVAPAGRMTTETNLEPMRSLINYAEES
ncbi:MFS transporter [Nocardia vinacea]|uniref:MFS transporter n=1 Tax=Nocardia vinacea TaxID=96468 RepID=UPI0033C657C1